MATFFQYNLATAFCALLLVFSGCTTTHQIEQQSEAIWNDDRTHRIDLLAAEARLRHGVQSGQVGRLVVLQIDRRSVFRGNVSSMALERWSDNRLDNHRVSDSPVCLDFLEALARAHPIPSDELPDLRWGFIFWSTDGTRLFSAYCDATGKRGVIDGACYTFEVGSLAELADSLFPKWMK